MGLLMVNLVFSHNFNTPNLNTSDILELKKTKKYNFVFMRTYLIVTFKKKKY